MRRGMRVLVGVVVLALPAAAHGSDISVRSVKPISGVNPFTADCGLHIPPPLPDQEFRPKDTAGEPHAAMNPRDPRNYAVAWIQDFGVSHTVAATLDGGRTWHRTDPPGLGTCTGGTHGGPFDPTITFGRDGTAYLVSMSGDVPLGSTTPVNAVLVNRSTDGGVTWSQPSEAQGATGYNDHPSIAVDPRDPDRVYVVWASLSGPFGASTDSLNIAISTDGGRTWGARRPIYKPPRLFLNSSGSALTVMRDGTLLYSFGQFESEGALPLPLPPPERRMMAMRSTDGGQSWSAPVVIGTTPLETPEDPDDEHGVTGENAPSLAASPDGSAYAVWGNRVAGGPDEIVVARTEDGVTWTRPHAVVAQRATPFLPVAAVARDGTVGIDWYDLRNDRSGDGQLTVDVWHAHSHDRGETWHESHLAGPFDMRTAWDDPRSFPSPTFFVGDYTGHIGLQEGFVAAVVLARPIAKLGKSQVFAARVRLKRNLRVRVRPRRLPVHARRRVRVRVRVRGASGMLPLRGARLRLGSERATTGVEGRAVLPIRFKRAGRRQLRVRSLEGTRATVPIRVVDD